MALVKHRFATIFAIACVAASGLAAADTTLGEIIDKGAERLAGDEIKYMLTNSVSRGKTPRGAPVDLRHHADGSLTGSYGSAKVVDGSWRVDDKDCMCVTASVPDLNLRFKDTCKIWYKLDVYIYTTMSASSDTDEKPSRDTQVVQRLLDRPDSPAPAANRR